MIKPTKYPYNPDQMAELFDDAVNQGKQGKQDTLVSGTNIKTINGSSVLGSGDLTVSTATSWGGITGTLSSQNDLNTALNAAKEKAGLKTFKDKLKNAPVKQHPGGPTTNNIIVADRNDILRSFIDAAHKKLE